MYTDCSVSLSKEQIMSPERWDTILQCKNDFLQNKIKDLRNYPQMNREIAESWIRSRNMQVDAYHPMIRHDVNNQEYKKIQEKYRPLIEITRPLFEILKGTIDTEYYLEIINKEGVSLLQEGAFKLPPIAKQGMVFTESTMGTNAHMLCMEHKQPVQVIGPEHYCVDLENIIASSAPIMDESGDAVASVVLTQPLKSSPPWEDSFCQQLSYTMRLLISIAAAVEAQIKLNNKDERLQMVNEHLAVVYDAIDAAVSCIDDGVIAIDRYGQILRSNPEGNRILKMNEMDYGQRNITEFLDSQSIFMNLLARGESAHIEETIRIGNDAQPYLLNIRPVLNRNNQQLELAILSLHHAERVNPLISNRNGGSTRFHFEDIIGQSATMKETIEKGKRFAGTEENILLIGESGTGKELVAQAVHNLHSPNGPFMAVNCAAMPASLIESELFGYEGGSFTGAERNGRPGKIELARGGTLFLDEIGDMPLELQAVLLRVLEDKEVMRIGGRRYKKVDFRVVAATNKDLLEMVRERRFREDLYFRLSVLPIQLPPLRKRGKDTEILSQYFLENYCRKRGFAVPKISAEAKKIIKQYDWPGNVRQLQNAMNYAINMVKGGVIEANHLPENIILDSGLVRLSGMGNSTGKGADTLSVKNLERAAIEVALVQAQNSIPRAALLLGMSKATLYRKLKDYNNE